MICMKNGHRVQLEYSSELEYWIVPPRGETLWGAGGALAHFPKSGWTGNRA